MRELILYLEPPVGFKQHVNSFLDMSKDKFGFTTANRYNCHVSMSGFFTVTDREQEVVQKAIEKVMDKLPMVQVQLTPLLVYTNDKPSHLLLPVVAPSFVHTMMASIAQECQDIVKLRLKKINHISLAYWNEQQKEWNPIVLKDIKKEADAWFKQTKEPKDTWDIVLYRRTKKSEEIGQPHVFEELKRWHG
ncbi:uncharacterized protein B0P05DRAFT_586657 [Gilbertella persicaria]|uniref:uncharacterized protein n=1 Tax=Gilbertella persicaria TaxID=101096 RepID=UPI00221F071B|nr:uncharacterized protein B0P05DRAFT_586657 [Gilbertella persicaria]KAI8080788.1 hypothetical protein B0P05DRAFT_586657 [Gilbertella persicaria]